MENTNNLDHTFTCGSIILTKSIALLSSALACKKYTNNNMEGEIDLPHIRTDIIAPLYIDYKTQNDIAGIGPNDLI